MTFLTMNRLQTFLIVTALIAVLNSKQCYRVRFNQLCQFCSTRSFCSGNSPPAQAQQRISPCPPRPQSAFAVPQICLAAISDGNIGSEIPTLSVFQSPCRPSVHACSSRPILPRDQIILHHHEGQSGGRRWREGGDGNGG